MNNDQPTELCTSWVVSCIKPSVGLLHDVVAVHRPSQVLRKMDTEELKCRDLFNIGPTNRFWAGNATIVVKKKSAAMDLHLRGFKRILLLTAKAWISSTTTFNKDGELRGTTSKTVKSSTNLGGVPTLNKVNFVPWGMPPFRFKGAETDAPTRVTWALPCKTDATHLNKLQWRLYCVESLKSKNITGVSRHHSSSISSLYHYIC